MGSFLSNGFFFLLEKVAFISCWWKRKWIPCKHEFYIQFSLFCWLEQNSLRNEHRKLIKSVKRSSKIYRTKSTSSSGKCCDYSLQDASHNVFRRCRESCHCRKQVGQGGNCNFHCFNKCSWSHTNCLKGLLTKCLSLAVFRRQTYQDFSADLTSLQIW